MGQAAVEENNATTKGITKYPLLLLDVIHTAQEIR
jgi:hypothetical protein